MELATVVFMVVCVAGSLAGFLAMVFFALYLWWRK